MRLRWITCRTFLYASVAERFQNRPNTIRSQHLPGQNVQQPLPCSSNAQLLGIRGFDQDPLFKLQNGLLLTRQKLVDLLQATLSAAGIDPTNYAGHSFRIGAANTAAANGIGDSTIQTLGRWASDTFTRYIRIPQQQQQQQQLAQLSATLA